MNIESKTEYLSAAQVRQRYGNVSHMWIVRKQRDASFPPPCYLGGRLRFWKASDLLAWERKTIAQGHDGIKKRKPPKNHHVA